jgi:hypothetical protein
MYLVPRAGAGPTILHPCKITLKSRHVYGPAPFAAEGFGQPIQLDAGDLSRFVDAGAEIKKQLERNFRADDVAGFLDRRRKLRQAFESVPQSFAKHLLDQLGDRGDPLARLFKFKLATPTRNEMITILLRTSGAIIDL